MTTVKFPNMGDDVLTEYVLDQHLQAAKAVSEITVDYQGHTYEYPDICSSLRKYLFQCTSFSLYPPEKKKRS